MHHHLRAFLLSICSLFHFNFNPTKKYFFLHIFMCLQLLIKALKKVSLSHFNSSIGTCWSKFWNTLKIVWHCGWQNLLFALENSSFILFLTHQHCASRNMTLQSFEKCMKISCIKRYFCIHLSLPWFPFCIQTPTNF